MRVKDTCPSCGATTSPEDLLCANCELILDPSKLPSQPSGSDFSVVRRLLEVPQRGVPSARPARSSNPAPQKGHEGPTRVFALTRTRGIPIVVASLTKKAASLNELEAFVVSFIDGESDFEVLAQRANINSFEMGVVLQALNDKMIVDFADETLDEDAPPPGEEYPTADVDARATLVPGDDEPVVTEPTRGAVAPATIRMEPVATEADQPTDHSGLTPTTKTRLTGHEATPTAPALAPLFAPVRLEIPPEPASPPPTPPPPDPLPPAVERKRASQKLRPMLPTPEPGSSPAPTPPAPAEATEQPPPPPKTPPPPDVRPPSVAAVSKASIIFAESWPTQRPAKSRDAGDVATRTVELPAQADAAPAISTSQTLQFGEGAPAVSTSQTLQFGEGELPGLTTSAPSQTLKFGEGELPDGAPAVSTSQTLQFGEGELPDGAPAVSTSQTLQFGEGELPGDSADARPASRTAQTLKFGDGELPDSSPSPGTSQTQTFGHAELPATSAAPKTLKLGQAELASASEQPPTSAAPRTVKLGPADLASAQAPGAPAPPRTQKLTPADLASGAPTATSAAPKTLKFGSADAFAQPPQTQKFGALPGKPARDEADAAPSLAAKTVELPWVAPDEVARKTVELPTAAPADSDPDRTVEAPPPAPSVPPAPKRPAAPQQIVFASAWPDTPAQPSEPPPPTPSSAQAVVYASAWPSEPAPPRPVAVPLVAPVEKPRVAATVVAVSAGPATRPELFLDEPSIIVAPISTPTELPADVLPSSSPPKQRRTLPPTSRTTSSRPAPPLRLDAKPGDPPRVMGPKTEVLQPVPDSPRAAQVITSPDALAAPRAAQVTTSPDLAARPAQVSTPPEVTARPAQLSTPPEVTARPAQTTTAPELPPALADTPVQGTDPRIIYRGKANRRVLDALKQVKRRDAGPDTTPPDGGRAADDTSTADRLAAGSLQVAIRMEQGGRLDEAIRYLENAVSKSPDAPSLYNRLAIILMRERGDLRRAEQLLQKAVELAPGHTVYEKNLATVLTRRATGK